MYIVLTCRALRKSPMPDSVDRTLDPMVRVQVLGASFRFHYVNVTIDTNAPLHLTFLSEISLKKENSENLLKFAYLHSKLESRNVKSKQANKLR